MNPIIKQVRGLIAEQGQTFQLITVDGEVVILSDVEIFSYEQVGTEHHFVLRDRDGVQVAFSLEGTDMHVLKSRAWAWKRAAKKWKRQAQDHRETVEGLIVQLRGQKAVIQELEKENYDLQHAAGKLVAEQLQKTIDAEKERDALRREVAELRRLLRQ